MRYRITHTTHYRYTTSDRTPAPVKLNPHVLRLYPRNDGSQWLENFDITISPKPTAQQYFLDVYGNTCLQVTVDSAITDWTIMTTSDVNTRRKNPFDYLSEPWAVELPIDYPSSLALQLQPYWECPKSIGIDDALSSEVLSFAQSIKQAVNNNVGYFLTHLAQKIPALCEYQPRTEGMPLPAAVTLRQKSGTCRDFTVLFMAVCRAVGLGARFVSGYQEGDLDSDAPNDLHAWAEVYIPGGGWRGFDPTLGLTVADRHIAIAAAQTPKQAAPVSGTLHPAGTIITHIDSTIDLKALST